MEFIVGDTEVVLDNLINEKQIIPDVVMVDPPRKGLDGVSIENILKIKPEKFVYISCNPATLVRDLSKFETIYDIKFLEAGVQMVPTTTVQLDEKAQEKMERLIERLDELDDVANIYHNWEE